MTDNEVLSEIRDITIYYKHKSYCNSTIIMYNYVYYILFKHYIKRKFVINQLLYRFSTYKTYRKTEHF